MPNLFQQLVDNSFENYVKFMVYRMFVDTADDNYVAARWSYINDLSSDFHWLSLHALEKYFKAALLLNGKSSRGYRHNLISLYSDFLNLHPDICIPEFKYPSWIYEDLLIDKENVSEYLSSLNKYGSADNRYASAGYDIGLESLHKVDHLIWHVRRHCCVFSERLIINGEITEKTNLQHLINNERETIYNGRLFDILKEETSERKSALLSSNFAFNPSANSPTHMRSAGTWGALRWVSLGLKDKHDPVKAEASRKAIAWARKNLSIGTEDRNFIAEQEKIANQNSVS